MGFPWSIGCLCSISGGCPIDLALIGMQKKKKNRKKGLTKEQDAMTDGNSGRDIGKSMVRRKNPIEPLSMVKVYFKRFLSLTERTTARIHHIYLASWKNRSISHLAITWNLISEEFLSLSTCLGPTLRLGDSLVIL